MHRQWRRACLIRRDVLDQMCEAGRPLVWPDGDDGSMLATARGERLGPTVSSLPPHRLASYGKRSGNSAYRPGDGGRRREWGATGPEFAPSRHEWMDHRRRLAWCPWSRSSPRAWTCASANRPGLCAAASCPIRARPSRRRSRIWPSMRSTCATGSRLERDRPYLVPLIEELHLPQEIRAKTNPKSSTGRLDVFTRVITDRSHRFDEIAASYHGKLYLEVVPRSFAIRVKQRPVAQPSAYQPRRGTLGRPGNTAVHEEVPAALPGQSRPACLGAVACRRLVPESRFIQGSPENIVGYRAKRNSLPVDLEHTSGGSEWQDYWEPVHPERGGRIVLESPRSSTCCSQPGETSQHPTLICRRDARLRPDRRRAALTTPAFSILASATPRTSAGTDRAAARGARARRAVHGRAPPARVQAGVERMAGEPDVLYGQDISSNYQAKRRCSASTSPSKGSRGPHLTRADPCGIAWIPTTPATAPGSPS